MSKSNYLTLQWSKLLSFVASFQELKIIHCINLWLRYNCHLKIENDFTKVYYKRKVLSSIISKLVSGHAMDIFFVVLWKPWFAKYEELTVFVMLLIRNVIYSNVYFKISLKVVVDEIAYTENCLYHKSNSRFSLCHIKKCGKTQEVISDILLSK